MKKITLLFLALLPFLGFGQSYYYDFDTDGDLEGFTQGGVSDLNVTGGSLNGSTFSGGYQQIRTPDGLGLVEADYTVVRLVVENLLTVTAGNHETFKIVNYDTGSTNVGQSVQSGNLAIPYGTGYQTIDFAIPTNPDNSGTLDRIGLRIQLAASSGLSGTLKIDQIIIINTITVDIVTNGDFEASGGSTSPWTTSGVFNAPALTAGNGSSNASRLTVSTTATQNNTLKNIDYVFSQTLLAQAVTATFDTKCNVPGVVMDLNIKTSLSGTVQNNYTNTGIVGAADIWELQSINKTLVSDFDTIQFIFRVRNNPIALTTSDYFDIDNVSLMLTYYDLTPGVSSPLITTVADGNWDATATWAGGVIPTALDDVQIEHDITLNGDQTAKDLTIATGKSLAINKSQSLTLTGNLVTDADVNNSLIMSVDSDEFSSLIVNGTAIGEIRFRRYVNNVEASGGNDLISPPVGISSFNDFYTDNASFFVEDPASDAVLFGPFDNSAIINAYVNFESTDTGALVQGKGYRMGTNVTLTSTSALNFHGTVETGTVNVPLTNPAGGSPWNLVGNPYSSYLSFKDFFDGLADYDGTTVGTNNQLDPSFTAIYGYDADNTDGSKWTIWDFNNTDYATDNITPGQGFFLRSKTGGGTATFVPDMRRVGTTDDFISGRTSSPNFAQIGLTLNSSSASYMTHLYFRDFNTLGLDPGFDTGAYSQTASGIFTHLIEDNNGIQMSKQSLPYSNLSNIQIPLVVNSNQGVQISFSLDVITNLPSNINVYLEDVVAGTITLLNTSDYVLTPASNLSGTGRFYAVFLDTALNTTEENFSNINIYTSEKDLMIEGFVLDNTNVKIYDLQGSAMISVPLDTTSQLNTINMRQFASGVYIVQLTNDTIVKSHKIVLK